MSYVHTTPDCREHHGLVRDFGGPRPRMFYPHAKTQHGHGEGVGHDSSEKVALDELHKRKIDLADYVYVLNVGGYVGDSTRSEIEYAERIGRSVSYLEPPHP